MSSGAKPKENAATRLAAVVARIPQQSPSHRLRIKTNLENLNAQIGKTRPRTSQSESHPRNARRRVAATLQGLSAELGEHSDGNDIYSQDSGNEVSGDGEEEGNSLSPTQFIEAVANGKYLFVSMNTDTWVVQKYDAPRGCPQRGYECVVNGKDGRLSCPCAQFAASLVHLGASGSGCDASCVHTELVNKHRGAAVHYDFEGITRDAKIFPLMKYDSGSTLSLCSAKPPQNPFAVCDSSSGSSSSDGGRSGNYSIVLVQDPKSSNPTMWCNHPTSDCECLKAMSAHYEAIKLREPAVRKRNTDQPSKRRVRTLPFRPIRQEHSE